jgi:glutamate-5-semialdehyde dehydrogenase
MNALNIAEVMHSLGLQAREASARMAAASAAEKGSALRGLAAQAARERAGAAGRERQGHRPCHRGRPRRA